jgi:hypothetical protein
MCSLNGGRQALVQGLWHVAYRLCGKTARASGLGTVLGTVLSVINSGSVSLSLGSLGKLRDIMYDIHGALGIECSRQFLHRQKHACIL